MLRELVIRNCNSNSSAPSISIDGNVDYVRISVEVTENGEVREDQVLFEGSEFTEARYAEKLLRSGRTDDLWKKEGKLS